MKFEEWTEELKKPAGTSKRDWAEMLQDWSDEREQLLEDLADMVNQHCRYAGELHAEVERLREEIQLITLPHGEREKALRIRAEKAEAYAKELEAKLDENRDDYIEQARKAEAQVEQLLEAAWEVVGECGLNGSIEKLEAVLKEVK